MTMEVEEHNLSHLLRTAFPLQKLEVLGKSPISSFVILYFFFTYVCVNVSPVEACHNKFIFVIWFSLNLNENSASIFSYIFTIENLFKYNRGSVLDSVYFTQTCLLLRSLKIPHFRDQFIFFIFDILLTF